MSDLVTRLSAALADRYRIERELGHGGMATVYLAHDLKHDRQVAVKVLRPDLAASLGAERFEREIRLAARLQHPHILPVFDSGAAGSRGSGEAEFLWYAMPYVEGESLRNRLDRAGELPVHEAVKLLLEVVDALAYAHGRGVVHRDIKPDNVMLSGRHALVADFGVAKAVSEAAGNTVTTAGVALGTPAYMAPEQATADPHLDHRVDIYAVGVLAYEILTGHTPFHGLNPQQTLAAHVTQEPDPISRSRPGINRTLEQVVLRCLAKRPSDRYQSAEELVAALEPLATPSGGMTPTETKPVAAVPPARRRSWIPGAVAVLLLGMAAAIALLLRRPPAPMVLGERRQVTLDEGLELDPAISPDGKFLAYVAGPPNAMRLFVRQLSGGGASALAKDITGNLRRPQWSPDGSRIAVVSPGGIEVIPMLAGTPKVLVPSEPGRPLPQMGWSPDGRQIAFVARDTLFVRPAEGGDARPLGRGSELHSVAWSPDGRWIAVVNGNLRFQFDARDLGNAAPSNIRVIDTRGGDWVNVTEGRTLNTSPVWVPGSHTLLFVSNRDGGRDIYQVSLDGSGRPRAEPVRLTTGLNAHTLTLSADGKALAYSTFSETVNVWSLPVPPAGTLSIGTAVPVTAENQTIEIFKLSPDGKWLGFDSNRDGKQHIFRRPLAGGEVEQLTTGDWDDFFGQYSPDGSEIAFHSFRNGNRDIFVMKSDGTGLEPAVTDSTEDSAPSWAPDGATLVYHSVNRVGRTSLRMVERREGRWGPSRELVPDGFRPGWSPDGRWIGYIDPTTGAVRAVSPDGKGARELASAPVGDDDPRPQLVTWSPDSRTLYYEGYSRNGESSLWAVPLEGGARRLAVRFDDASKQAARYGLTVSGGRFYLTLGSRQADIWMTEVRGEK